MKFVAHAHEYLHSGSITFRSVIESEQAAAAQAQDISTGNILAKT
jgi:hypothetical protein